MKRLITENLHEVSFHDSSIENVVRGDNVTTLFFDWAKVTHEQRSLVVGQCKLDLHSPSGETLTPPQYAKTCLGFEFTLIGVNSSNSDQHLKLGGFYDSKNDYLWLDWNCTFLSFQFSWLDHVTLEEWKAGKLPA